MRTRRLLALDVALALTVVLSLVAFLRSPDAHGLVSLALVAAVALHLGVHVRWVRRAVRARGWRVRRDLTVATALLAVFVPLALTGVSLLTNLDRGDDVHTVAGWAFVALAAVHVALHARWLRSAW